MLIDLNLDEIETILCWFNVCDAEFTLQDGEEKLSEKLHSIKEKLEKEKGEV